MLLLAKTDPAADPPHTGMTGFLVEKEPEADLPGLTIPMPGLKKLGYKGVESTELVFDGFRTPASSVLGGDAGVGQGFKYFMSGIEVGRVNVAARGAGIAQAALDDAIRYAQEREAFGKPIAHHQAVQLMLAKMATRAEAARLLVVQAAQAKARGERADLEAGMAKYFATEAAQENALDCDAHPRRLRLLARVPARALLPRRAAAPDRRGLERDPAADHRAPAARTARSGLLDSARAGRDPRRRARALRGLPGRVLARARARPLPGGVRRALTENGWLAALIPEEYGGAGLGLTAASVILEEINASGGNSGACHAQMYTMGTILRHGSDEQKQRYLPQDRVGRAAAAGVRRDRADGRLGHDAIQTTAERVDGGYVVRGQKIWTSRALHSDLMLLLARTTPLEEVEKRTEGLSTFIVDMKRRSRTGR